MVKKTEVFQAIAVLATNYCHTYPDALQKLWADRLARFPDGSVECAVMRLIETERKSFKPPELAEIIALIETATGQRWMTGNEAWARIPRTEADSAVITQEAQEALNTVQGLLDRGEDIAARMAFIAAYDAKIDQRKAVGATPRYYPTLGTDKNGREAILRDGVTLGLISQKQALVALPDVFERRFEDERKAHLLIEGKPSGKSAAQEALQAAKLAAIAGQLAANKRMHKAPHEAEKDLTAGALMDCNHATGIVQLSAVDSVDLINGRR